MGRILLSQMTSDMLATVATVVCTQHVLSFPEQQPHGIEYPPFDVCLVIVLHSVPTCNVCTSVSRSGQFETNSHEWGGLCDICSARGIRVNQQKPRLDSGLWSIDYT